MISESNSPLVANISVSHEKTTLSNNVINNCTTTQDYGSNGNGSTSGTINECPICFRVLSSIRSLNNHILFVHFKEPKENHNGGVRNKKVSMRRVTAAVLKVQKSEKEAYVCPVCLRSFRDNLELKLHVHSLCTDAARNFRGNGESENVEKTKLIASKSNPKGQTWECKICGRKLSSSWNLQRHMNNAQAHTYKAPHVPIQQECKLCGYITTDPFRYRRHCGSFKHQDNLRNSKIQRHEFLLRFRRKLKKKVSTQRSRVQCILCSKWFKSKASRTTHSNFRHKRIKPFHCFCGHTCSFRYLLDEHLRCQHTSLKRHKCIVSQCKMVFVAADRLKRHLLQVHGIEDKDDEDDMIEEINVINLADSRTSEHSKDNNKLQEKDRQCRYCHVYCATETALINHLKRHSKL